MEVLLDVVADRFKFAIAAMIILLGAFRWLMGRRDLQFSRRKDFVQNWKNPYVLDALSVEVMVRQLFGAYLPAYLVRRICDQPGVEVSRTLSELGEVWELVDWSESDCQIAWKAAASTPRRRGWAVVFLWGGYFVSAFIGGTILYVVATAPVAMAISVASTVWAFVFLGLALVALSKMAAWGAACRLGDGFISDINQKIIRLAAPVPATVSTSCKEVVALEAITADRQIPPAGAEAACLR